MKLIKRHLPARPDAIQKIAIVKKIEINNNFYMYRASTFSQITEIKKTYREHLMNFNRKEKLINTIE